MSSTVPVTVLSTRIRRRESLALIARSAPLNPRVYISELEALQSFTDVASFNPALGLAVEELAISIPSLTSYPAETIRRCLRLTPNVETMILNLSHTTPPSILNGLLFPRLVAFSTNLPHRIVAAFLDAHPSIHGLILSSRQCVASCPLELGQLTHLHCSSRCLGGVTRRIITTMPVQQSSLTSLIIDYSPHECDILTAVVAIAPNLHSLIINEKPGPQGWSGRVCRPWNDINAWHRTLLRLPFLNEFKLRTLLKLARSPRAERMAVVGWVSGTSRRADPHPSLYHIAIIQKESGGASLQQRLSHWYEGDGGVWERVIHQAVGATHSFVR